MENPVCKKVTSMLSAYIEKKLNEKDCFFVENHILKCPKCRDKYLEMKEITKNLRFEYEKLLIELEREEENKLFKMREYELFKNNISSYIDNELDYDESVKFRKYLIKSKPARIELSEAYGLRTGIRNSFSCYQNKLNFNCSRKIIKKLKSENDKKFDLYYTRAAVTLGIVILSFLIISVYFLFNYFNSAYAAHSINHDTKIAKSAENINIFGDENMIEVYFDEKGEMIITDK